MIFQLGGVIRIDDEELGVREINGTTHVLTVQRGINGTTAATHLTAAPIQVFDFFDDSTLNDAINEAISNMYPELFAMGVDSSLTFVANTFQYAVPAPITAANGKIWDIEVYTATEPFGSPVSNYRILPTGHIIFDRDYYGFLCRIFFLKPFAKLTDDVTTSMVPEYAERLLNLAAELICYEGMMVDREKFDRYATASWNRANNEYALSNYLAACFNMYRDELERVKQDFPMVRRWA
ncbi:MAG: hypothetical protein ACYC3G_00575 [Minisyncoccota bacterium]